MTLLPYVQGEFRVVDDPELRFTPSGKAVANLRVAANSHKQDAGGNWVDDKKCFLSASVWEGMAEHVAESLRKGDLVNITGRIETREYENRDGDKRTSFDLHVDTIGPSLKYEDVTIMRRERGQQSQGGQQRQQPQQQQSRPAPQEDPWAAPTGQQEEPPF